MRRNILLVSRDADLPEFAAEVMAKEAPGYALVHSAHGRNVIDDVLTHNVGGIILDWRLKDPDCTTIHQMLSRDPRTRQHPVVAISTSKEFRDILYPVMRAGAHLLNSAQFPVSRPLAVSGEIFGRETREFLTGLQEDLKQMQRQTTVDPAQLGGINHKINRFLSSATQLESIRTVMEGHEDVFLEKLTLRHPELTRGELKFCTMLRFNLSTKELARVMQVSPAAIEKKRYRLRKKLNLNTGAAIEPYLQTL